MMDINNKAARTKNTILQVLSYCFLVFLTILCLIFFYLLIANASKDNRELINFEPWLSSHFFENASTAWLHPTSSNVDIPKGMWNSVLVASATALLTTYFSALTAYGIYAYRFKGRKFISAFILAIMMIPAQVSSVGFISIAYDNNLTDNYWMLILPGIAAPATYFYMLQYLKATLPLELVEASRIDGYNEFSTFNRIVLPVMKPALAVQFIFSFVASWNNYYMPSLLITDTEKRTLPVMLAMLRSDAESKVDNGQIWMVVFLAILPVLVVYLCFSRFIIKGVTSGSVKG